MSNTSSIAESATIGVGTRIGAFCVIEEDVRIGTDCRIGHHVVIRRGTSVGDGVRIDDHTSIGKQPMRAKASAVTGGEDRPAAVIGDDVIIGSNVVIYAGSRIGRNVLVADLATIREDVVIGEATIVGRGVAIENRCIIGERCKLETNAYLTAFSNIADQVFIAPGVLTSNDNFLGRTEERFRHFGGVTIERGGRLAVGAVILPNRTVREEAVVAAGAVLTRDAEPGMIYAGLPARPLRPVPEEQKLPNSRG